MPKKQRLSRADFSKITSAKSRRYFGAYFSLSVVPFSPEKTLSEPKFACVVSKKAAKHAVDRNGIKRRCREAVRLATRGRPLAASLIFYAKKEAVGASYARIEQDVGALLSQLRPATSTASD